MISSSFSFFAAKESYNGSSRTILLFVIIESPMTKFNISSADSLTDALSERRGDNSFIVVLEAVFKVTL